MKKATTGFQMQYQLDRNRLNKATRAIKNTNPTKVIEQAMKQVSTVMLEATPLITSITLSPVGFHIKSKS